MAATGPRQEKNRMKILIFCVPKAKIWIFTLFPEHSGNK